MWPPIPAFCGVLCRGQLPLLWRCWLLDVALLHNITTTTATNTSSTRERESELESGNPVATDLRFLSRCM